MRPLTPLFRLPPIFVAICSLGCASVSQAAAPDIPAKNPDMDALETETHAAVGILLGQNESGGWDALCTVTAFERSGQTYRFLTAAHCVAEDDQKNGRVAVAQTRWAISFDDKVGIHFYGADIVGVGYQRRGDDFAILEAVLDREIKPVRLAKKDAGYGENVINIAAPLGLGKQLFRGHVSLPDLDRPIVEGSINWRHANLLQVNVGPGSSGSTVLSRRQGAVVAILVGNISKRSSPNVVAIPISKFQTFRKDLQNDDYRWYQGDGPEATSSAAAPTVQTLLDKEYERWGWPKPSSRQPKSDSE